VTGVLGSPPLLLLLEVAVERGVGGHLYPEVLEDRHAAGGPADHRGGSAHLLFRDVGLAARRGHVDPHEVGEHFVETARVVGQPGPRKIPLGGEDLEERRQQVGVTAGGRPEVDVGHLRALGEPGVDDDARASGVLGDGLQHATGLREPV